MVVSFFNPPPSAVDRLRERLENAILLLKKVLFFIFGRLSVISIQDDDGDCEICGVLFGNYVILLLMCHNDLVLFAFGFIFKGGCDNLMLFQDIFQKFQLWKPIVSIFAFSSTPELLFGLYLLYYFRVFERQIGSNKYSVFILFSVAVSLLLEVAALVLLRDPSLNVITSGPYGLIFSSFVPFFLDIPVSTRFRVFGFRFSDKSFIYLAGLQLLLSSWKRSILPGLCGILAGCLYRMNVFYIRQMKFPAFITSALSRLSFPSSGSSNSTTTMRNILGSVPSYPGRQVERTYANALMEPPEDSIATLVSMGFDRNHARQALLQARNDMNVATNILLEAHSH